MRTALILAALGYGGPIAPQPPGTVLPMIATIPALYGTPNGFPSTLTMAPQPNFSLGLGSNAAPSVATKLYVDTSLIAQGGSGVLTDDLLLYQAGYWGRGDSSGFSVQPDGELVLSDEQAYINRASGPIRKMYWVQTLGGTTTTQTITLTLDATKARQWNSATINSRRRSSDPTTAAYNYVDTQDVDYPIVSTYMAPPIAGITFAVGVSDAKIFSGAIKRAIASGTAAGLNIVLHTDLQPYFTVTQGKGEDQPPAGRTYVPTIKLNSKAANSPRWVIDGWDFRGLWIGQISQGLTNAPIFKNCLFDASAINSYLTYTTPGNTQPDNVFVARRPRVDLTDPTYTRLLIDNLDEYKAHAMLAFGTVGNPSPTTGRGTWRTISPSQPGTQGDAFWNAFDASVTNSVTTADATGLVLRDTMLKTSASNSGAVLYVTKGAAGGRDQIPIAVGIQGAITILSITSIKSTTGTTFTGYTLTSDGYVDWSGASSPPAPGSTYIIVYTYVANMPTDLLMIVSCPGAGSQERFAGVGMIALSLLLTFEYCRFDGAISGFKFGGPGQTFLLFTTGSLGGIDTKTIDASSTTGQFTGMRYCALVNSPQDILDCGIGYRAYNLLTASCTSDGPHVDGMQIGGIGALSDGTFLSEYEYMDTRHRFYDQSMFIDPVVNGKTTNPYFVAYAGGGDPSKVKMSIGGIDAAYYYEFNGPINPSHGKSEVRYNVIRSAGYNISALNGTEPSVVFSQTNPMAVTASGASQQNTATNPTNALIMFPGHVMPDNGLSGVKIAALSPPVGGALPPCMTPHKAYTIAGYGFGYFSVSANNVTGGAAVGDQFQLGGGTLVAPFNAPTTIQVTSVNGSGVPTGFKLVHPGIYRYRPTGTLTMSPSSGSATGTVTISPAALADTGNVGYTHTFVLADENGNLLDSSGSNVGTASPTSGLIPVAQTTASTNTLTNKHKQVELGMCSFHDNWLEGYTLPATIYMQRHVVDPQGNNRMPIDIWSVYNNRFLFNAPAYEYDPGDGNGPLAAIGELITTPANTTVTLLSTYVNPPPGALANFTAAANGATTARVTFKPDPNARCSPDTYAVNNPAGYQPINASGYRYRITPTSTGVAGSWKPASAAPTGNSTSGYIDVTDTVLVTGASYLIEMQSLSTWAQPELLPQQFGTIASASVTM